MVETLVKAVSLNELSSKVRRAFYRMGFEEDCWFDGVEEVYDGYAIICMSYGEYYQAPYSITAEGEIMPSSPDLWLPVEKEWVAKNAVKYADRKVVFGSKVKALGDGKVGGYLVLFSSPNQPDLYGDYFDSETDFDIENGVKTSIYYNHGFDPVLQKRRLGKAAIGLDDVGVWIQGQLDLRDEYEQAVYKLVKMEKVGWSSGTASHLVEVEETGKTCHIKRWPLGLDASLTPTPADPRQIVPIKSLKSDTSLLSAVLPETAPEAGQHPAVLVANDADDVTPVKSAGTLASNSTHEDTIMPEVNPAAVTPTATAAPIVAPAADDRMAQFEARFKSMEDALNQFGAKFDIMLKSPAVADMIS